MRPWNPNTKSAGRPGDWTPPLRQTVPAGAHCASAHWATEAGLWYVSLIIAPILMTLTEFLFKGIPKPTFRKMAYRYLKNVAYCIMCNVHLGAECHCCWFLTVYSELLQPLYIFSLTPHLFHYENWRKIGMVWPEVLHTAVLQLWNLIVHVCNMNLQLILTT